MFPFLPPPSSSPSSSFFFFSPYRTYPCYKNNRVPFLTGLFQGPPWPPGWQPSDVLAVKKGQVVTSPPRICRRKGAHPSVGGGLFCCRARLGKEGPKGPGLAPLQLCPPAGLGPPAGTGAAFGPRVEAAVFVAKYLPWCPPSLWRLCQGHGLEGKRPQRMSW